MARFLIFCLLLSTPALAQSLADPLRPPPGFAEKGGASAQTEGELVLKSVLLAQGRKIALIGEQTLAVGDRVGGYRLTQLSENRAVLQGSQGRLQLYLIPQSKKQFVRSGARPLAPLSSGGTQK